MKKYLTLITLIVLGVSACAPQSQPTPDPATTPKVFLTPTGGLPTPSPTESGPAPTVQPLPKNTTYTIELVFDYESKTAEVDLQLVYYNHTEHSLDDLVFMVEPNLDAGVFEWRSLKWLDGSVLDDYELTGGIMTLPLEPALAPGDSVALELSYTLRLPNRPGLRGYTARQVNLGDWYPFVPPYDAELGWLAYARNQVGEHLSYDLADFEVTLSVDNAPEGLIVAASSLPTHEEGVYSFHFPRARNFVISMSPNYEVYETEVDGIRMLSYGFIETRAATQAALEHSAQALALFQELFTPYHRESLTIIAANFPDGMEYDGLYFMGQEYYVQYDGDVTNVLTFVAVHETCHQWWYAQLANNQAMDPWLDEAFSAYCEPLYYERYYPDYLNWWWKFRVEYYEVESGFIDDSIYQYGSFRPYIDTIYLRGVYFLRDLRVWVGTDTFYKILKEYAETYQGQAVTADDFFTIVSQESAEDISPLVDRYFSP